MLIGGTDVEAETPIFWPPDAKSWLILKDPDVGKDWGQEGKGTTEDEMVGWHHRLSGHEFGSTLGVGDGQAGLACCGSWDCKELDMTERLNWTELSWIYNHPPMSMGYWLQGPLIPKSANTQILLQLVSVSSTCTEVQPTLDQKYLMAKWKKKMSKEETQKELKR